MIKMLMGLRLNYKDAGIEKYSKDCVIINQSTVNRRMRYLFLKEPPEPAQAG